MLEGMAVRRAQWPALLAVLAIGWLATPHAVPIYDGLGNPDEPYRLLSAQLGRTAAPTEASAALPVVDGINQGGRIANSGESGPQVQVYAPARAFGVPPPGATITVLAKPVPLVDAPLIGKPDSNVYELGFASAGGPVTLRQGAQSPTMTMRAVTVGPPAPVLDYRPGGSGQGAWRRLSTSRTGTDIFTAVVPGAGQYLLVQPPAGRASGSGLLYGSVGVGLGLATLGIVLIRLRSRTR